jgi:pimeloyl-ACP methyl ester carboxylesterase
MKTNSYLRHCGEFQLALRQRGKGIPFVWGHSLMGSMRTEDGAALWDWEQIQEIAKVIRYDARGHGNSDGSYEPEDYRWPHLASDMLAIGRDAVADSDWRRCVLGGISMGAATALEAAAQRPDEVAGMVLVIPPTAWATRPRQAAIYRRLSWVSGLLGSAPYRLLDLLPVPVREDGRSRLGLSTARGLALANPRQVRAALRGAALSDMPDPDVLAKIDIPTLILAWENDAAHPVSSAEKLVNYLPDVRKLVISHPDDLSEWLPAILDFLLQVAAQEKKRQRGRRGAQGRARR